MDDRWITIPNWGRFQHYGDRAPLWIKVYLEVAHRDDWRTLTLAQRGLLVSLWVEYAAANGLIRTSDVPGRVAQKVPRRTWDLLQAAGFVTLSASKPEPVRASGPRAGAPAPSREVEVEIEPPYPPQTRGDKPSRQGRSKPAERLPFSAIDQPQPTKQLERALAFTRNAGHQYERTSYAEELERMGLDPDEEQQVWVLWDELREAQAEPALPVIAAANGQPEELPWEGEEPPVVAN